MRLVILRGVCGDGRTCPNINITDRQSYVVQGYHPAHPDAGSWKLGSTEAVVEIPSSLLPELGAHENVHGAVSRTRRGTLLVRGRLVVEPDTLRELNLPPGEAAVEVPVSAMPRLEMAHVR